MPVEELENSVRYTQEVGRKVGTVRSQCLIACGWTDVQALGHPAPQESHFRYCVAPGQCRGRRSQLIASRGEHSMALRPVLYGVSSKCFLNFLFPKKKYS